MLPDNVRAALDATGAPYEVLACDPALADTAAFCEHYKFPPANAANAIVVAAKKEPREYAVCLVLATTKLDVNHRVRDLLGARKVSFADAEETQAVTGMMIGGVTPFGLDLPVYVDSRVMTLDYAIVGGGNRSAKLKISPEAFRRLPRVQIVDGLGIDRLIG
jgi:prolyl-tRNA editing enzyme YbaK/EbsC (Cys-tRNA(Pro) deacylase)